MRVTVVMSPELVAAVDLAATREGRSRSAAMVAAAERWCEGRGTWPPGAPVDNGEINAPIDEAAAATTAPDIAAAINAPGPDRWVERFIDDWMEMHQRWPPRLIRLVRREAQDG